MPTSDPAGRRHLDSSRIDLQTAQQRTQQSINQSSYVPHGPSRGISESVSGLAEGPSFSRFLSSSIIPLYKSKQFPSNQSDAPLFYSTREGYEVGLKEDEDIIPKENDHRLQTGLGHGKGRGIDEEAEESDSSRLLTNPQARNPPNKHLDYGNSESPCEPRPSSAYIDEDYVEGGEDDDNPFYADDHLAQHQVHHSLDQPVMQLPRHLMASHALSHLMASEIAYGNQQYQTGSASNLTPTHHLVHQPMNSRQPVLNPSSSNGWKMYQTLNPSIYTDEYPHSHSHHLPVHDAESQLLQQPHASSYPIRAGTHHTTQITDTSNSRARLSHSSELSRTTTDLPKHPLLRPRPPERFDLQHPTHRNSETPALASHSDSPNLLLPDPFSAAPYIYPSEARDIGADVLGHPGLGPQNYRDSFWLALWLTSLIYAFMQTLWVIFIAKGSDTGSSQSSYTSQPNLMRSLPILALLITLTFGFCLMSLSLLVMVKKSIKVLVYGSLVGVPLVLSMIGMWTWSESLSEAAFEGMGWVSVATFLTSFVLVKLVWNQRQRIDRTIKVLELSTGVIIEHPSLILVCLAITMSCIVMSLPFVTLVYKLVLLGSYDRNQWVITSGPITQVLLAGFIWSWTLNVIRNLQRIIISGVVSHWYFNRHSPPSSTYKGYSTIESTYQSISRAIGPSLGTVCLASFLLTCFDTTRKMLNWSKKLTSSRPSTPAPENGGQGLVHFIFCSNPISKMILNNVLLVVAPMVGFGCKMFEFLTNYTIIYSGITGFSYWEASRRVNSLLNRNGQTGLAHSMFMSFITLQQANH